MLTGPHIERVPMSKAEYFHLAADRDNCLVDWEEGVAVKMTPAHSRHGLFILRLCNLMGDVLSVGAKGQLWVEVFVDFGSKIYGEDIAVLFSEHLDRHVEGLISGVPDIVVEVVSEDSVVRDRTDKFSAYCKFGVPWYWIGDPIGPSIEEYKHTPEGYLRTTSGTLETPFTPRALPGLIVDLNALMKPGFP